jgi:hypothetical protein
MSGTTLDLIAGYLTDLGWRYDLDAESGYIRSGFAGTTNNFHVIIRLFSEQQAIGIRIPEIMHLQERRRLEVMQALLMINYGLMLGGFGVDPRDGEVDFETNVPIDDATLSKEQFLQMLGATCVTVDHFYGVLNQVLWGNVAPLDAIMSSQPDKAVDEEVPV